MTETSIKTEIKSRFQKPTFYKVLMFDNPFTTFTAVIDVLMSVFGKSREEAEEIAQIIHTNDSATVMISSKEICSHKVSEAYTYCSSKSGDSDINNYGLLKLAIEEIKE